MKRFWLVVLVLLIAAVGLYARPLPAVQAQSQPPKVSVSGKISVPWPNYGQAALGAVGYGVLATHGQQKTVPIASIAKVVTALAVLQKKPLQLNQQGPIITLGANDVAIYQKYVKEDGSVVKVVKGEEISELEALRAMLLPSANNIADSLANWAFGSQADYVKYANKYLAGLGLSQTTVADASGFSPSTTSTAHDLVLLGEKALANPVVADVVDQAQGIVPVAGSIANVNYLLGKDGVNGIKTGNTDQAGGCFLFSAQTYVGGQTVEIVGAILGAPHSSSPSQAIDDSRPIIATAGNNFQKLQIVKKGQVVGNYTSKWGEQSSVVATKDLNLVVWKTDKPAVAIKLDDLAAPATAGAATGSLNVVTGHADQSVPLGLKSGIAKPSLLWRIFHF